MQRSLNMFHILELVKCAHYLILILKLKSKLQTNFTRQQYPSIVVLTVNIKGQHQNQYNRKLIESY